MRRVLIIDSDPVWIKQISQTLAPLGAAYHIHAVSSLAQAGRLIKVEPLDLVLLPPPLLVHRRLAHLRWCLENKSPPQVVLLTTADRVSPDLPGLLGLRQIQKYTLDQHLPGLMADLYPETLDSTMTERETRTIKVALVGDSSVGKTTLMFRLRTGKFRDLRILTIGVDFHTYEFDLRVVRYRLIVWDLGGQDRFRVLRRAFYRGSHVIGLIFDVGNHATFFNLPRLWREIHEELGDVPVMLVGNKIDLARQVSREEAESLARAWNLPYAEISCQSGENVHNLFVELAQYALEEDENEKTQE